MKLHHTILFVLLMICPQLQAAIEVSVDRSSVHVNESFQLFFEADESPDDDPDFSPLEQHFAVVNTSQNNSISIVNGDYQRSFKWTLQLIPKQVGEIIVPAIYFGDDKTKPFQISVKPASQSSAGSAGGLIFELSADRESVAVQGQVVITMRLMSDANITAYEFGELLVENIDAVIEPLGDVKRFQTRLGDKPYLVLEQKFALFPQSSGSLEIKPILGQVRLSSSGSVFDPFQSRGEIRSAHSPELKVDVTGINPTFTGQHWLPASNLRLNEVWQEDFDQLVAGEPITRTIMLVAEGLTAAQLPTLDHPSMAGLKQYPDQPVLEDQRGEAGIIGMRQQKFALIPTAGGSYTLPEISIPWWNINSGQQEIATLPARTIQVSVAQQAGESVPEPASAPVSSSNQPVAPVEVVAQNNTFWVWVSLFLACGWLASALFWWWGRRKSETLSEPLQKQMTRGRASKNLEEVCKNNDAAAARDALMQWARVLDSENPVQNLNQLGLRFGEPLKSLIDDMNQCLYSDRRGDWLGGELWRICESIEKEIPENPTSSAQSLINLNP